MAQWVRTFRWAGSARLYLVKELKELGAGLVDGADDGATAQGQGLHEGQHLEAGRTVQATGGGANKEEWCQEGIRGIRGWANDVVNVTEHWTTSDYTVLLTVHDRSVLVETLTFLVSMSSSVQKADV